MRKINLTKEEIERAKQQSSCVEDMLKILNVKYCTLYWRCRDYGIKLIDFNKKWHFNYAQFMDLYNKGLNDTEIGKIINIPSKRVCDYRNKLGLESNTLKEIQITDEQYQIIIGGLLGDSSMSRPHGSEMPFLTFSHSLKQKEYCKWKYNKLKPLTNYFAGHSEFDKRTKKTYYSYVARSRQNKCLLSIYNSFYKIINGKKVKYIDENILNKLTPLGLAIWYQDDGFKSTNGAYYLATNCFSSDDLQKIQDALLFKFNISTSIHCDNQIYIKKSSAKQLESLINPYIQDCCKYKLHSCCKTPLNGETPEMDNPVPNPLETKENA